MDNEATLPPLPGSDAVSLQTNKKDNFYEIGAREFWGENQIISEKVEDFKQCDHKFMKEENITRCQKCHFGLLGNNLEIRDGKLFYGGEPLGL